LPPQRLDKGAIFGTQMRKDATAAATATVTTTATR